MFGWNRKQRRANVRKRGVGYTRQYSSKRARQKFGTKCLGQISATVVEDTAEETPEVSDE